MHYKICGVYLKRLSMLLLSRPDNGSRCIIVWSRKFKYYILTILYIGDEHIIVYNNLKNTNQQSPVGFCGVINAHNGIVQKNVILLP